MKHLVTGAAGFIGSHVVDTLLARGDEVLGLDNLFTGHRRNLAHIPGDARFEFVRHDVCDPFHFEVDQIWHLACPASPVQYQRNPVRTIETAVLGTRNALLCARATGAKLLITSTSEIYGDPLEHPQHESYWGNVNPVGPRACYDEGKRCGESLATAWARQYGTPVAIARLFNTYGPRMASGDGRLLPNLITQALRREPVTIFGDGSQTRSFCYVSDTVGGLSKLMARLLHGDFQHRNPLVVNLGNPDERSIESVARAVLHELDAVEWERRELPADDPKRRCPDITRARELLDWNPTVSFEDGFRKTVEWFKAEHAHKRPSA